MRIVRTGCQSVIVQFLAYEGLVVTRPGGGVLMAVTALVMAATSLYTKIACGWLQKLASQPPNRCRLFIVYFKHAPGEYFLRALDKNNLNPYLHFDEVPNDDM